MTATTKTRSSASAQHPAEALTEYVTLHLADQLFGAPVTEVHDVFAPQNLTPVPLSQAEVAGVLNLRGRIVTAIDTRARLGLEPRKHNADCMAVGVEFNGESFGLIIDGVGEVMGLPTDGVESTPSNLDPRWQAVSRGVYRLDGRLLIILDIPAILNLEASP